jgi:NAD(P)H-flavin reductase/ferredoxin
MKTTHLLFNGQLYECQPEETVLDVLLRQKVDVPYSCKKQICMSCMMQCLNGLPPIKSQVNLKETLRLQNNFLACACIPECDMEIALNQETLTRQVGGQVIELNRLNQNMMELVLQCEIPVDYHGGQSALLLNYEQIGKKFPIASPTSAKSNGRLVVHVKRLAGAAFSAWIHDNLRIGDTLFICGISGELYYTPGQPTQSLLMVAWNGDLGAMIGLIQDIFENNHTGPLYLLHSVADSEQLYFATELDEISHYFSNFHYIPCVDRGPLPQNGQQGPVDKIVAKTLPNLSHWKVFLCGNRTQIHTVQRQAYLAGAAMKDIYLDVTAL